MFLLKGFYIIEGDIHFWATAYDVHTSMCHFMQYEVLYALGYDTANNSMFCLTEATLIMYKITIAYIF